MQTSVERQWRRLRRERLIEAARRVFAEHGFEKASMDDIASAAGAGKPTLYRYFASKDALYEAVFVDALDSLEEHLSAAERSAGDPEQALRAMIGALVPLFREHVATLRTLSDAAGAADRSRRRILRQRAGDIEARLAVVLARGRRIGAFRHADDALMARLLYGMVWSGSAASKWNDPAVVDAMMATVVRQERALVRIVQGPETIEEDAARAPVDVAAAAGGGS